MNELLFGLSVMLIGLLVVFTGLVLLIFCIKLITLISNKSEHKKKAALSPAPEAEDAAEANAESVPAVEPGIAPETVAAITAAIAAVWQGDAGFVVRRVRRVRNAAAWNVAGREDQVYSRM